MKNIVLIIVFLCFFGCTNTSDAKRVLGDQGYTEIEITGFRPFICGKDYNFSTGFKAKAPNTHRLVTGAVCSGFMKGNSIKLD